jgi:hypothetical protein
MSATPNINPAKIKGNKYDATTAPTGGDDSADGYAVGSVWVNVNTDKSYICLDASVNAAVWKEITVDGLQTLGKDFSVESPAAGDDFTIFRTDVAITVTQVREVHVGTSPSTTFAIKYASDRSAAGTDLVSSTTSTDAANGNVQGLVNTSIPAGSWIWYEVSAASGTDVVHSVHIRFTED